MGKESLEDGVRCGRPTTATAEENIAHVHRVVIDDRRLVVSRIGYTAGISRERVENILHNELRVWKVFAVWVPRLLTSDQKLTRLTLTPANMAIFKADKASFLGRFECWVQHFEPETRR